eukprot:scaffold266095_cov31-Attheya_sp.AAC.1
MATPFRHPSPPTIAAAPPTVQDGPAVDDGDSIQAQVVTYDRKIATIVLGGVDNIWIKPGSKVLYIGAAVGTSVLYVSDIVGSTGIVYTVEFLAQPGQARIVALNSHYFLKNGGHAVIAVKASCIDSTAAPDAVFRREVSKLQAEIFKPLEQLTLEPLAISIY